MPAKSKSAKKAMPPVEIGRGSVTLIFICAMPPGGTVSLLTLSDTPLSSVARSEAGIRISESAATAAAVQRPALKFVLMGSILRRAPGDGNTKPVHSGFRDHLVRRVPCPDLPEDGFARNELADDGGWKLDARVRRSLTPQRCAVDLEDR